MIQSNLTPYFQLTGKFKVQTGTSTVKPSFLTLSTLKTSTIFSLAVIAYVKSNRVRSLSKPMSNVSKAPHTISQEFSWKNKTVTSFSFCFFYLPNLSSFFYLPYVYSLTYS